MAIAKSKNPLYVVKENQVEEASNFFDLFLKKFNLEPLWDILMSILKMMMENVTSYAGLKMVNDYIELIVSKFKLFQKYSII